jgi:hypothetical protein
MGKAERAKRGRGKGKEMARREKERARKGQEEGAGNVREHLECKERARKDGKERQEIKRSRRDIRDEAP